MSMYTSGIDALGFRVDNGASVRENVGVSKSSRVGDATTVSLGSGVGIAVVLLASIDGRGDEGVLESISGVDTG